METRYWRLLREKFTYLTSEGFPSLPLPFRVKNLCHPRSLPVLCPPIEWCGDNAAMIAWTGVERYKLGLTDPLDLPMMPKWSMEGLKNTESPEEDLGTDGKEWRRKVLNKEK